MKVFDICLKNKEVLEERNIEHMYNFICVWGEMA